MKNIIIGFAVALLLFAGGFLLGRFAFQPEPVVKIVTQEKIVTKWKSRIVTSKQVYKMPVNELQAELLKYVDSEPMMDIKILKDKNIVRATASLGDREWSRDAHFKVEVSRKGNWKMCLGIGAGLVAVGVASHIIIRKKMK